MSDFVDQNQPWLKLGIAAQLERQYNADTRDFFQSLAILLETMLPETAQVEKRGGLFAKKKAFRITIPHAESRLLLQEDTGGVLRASRIHIVKGIALKTEELSMEEWLSELSEMLEARARQSADTRELLSKFVEF